MTLQTSVSAREYRESSEPERFIVPKELAFPGLTQKNDPESPRYALMYQNGQREIFERTEDRN